MDQVIGIHRFCMKFNIMNFYTYVSCQMQSGTNPATPMDTTWIKSEAWMTGHWTKPNCRRRKSPISGSLLFHSSGSTERGAQPNNVLHSPWVPKPADPLRCSRSFKLGIMINILPTLLFSFTWMPASTGNAAARPLVKIPKTNCTTKTSSSILCCAISPVQVPKKFLVKVWSYYPHASLQKKTWSLELPTAAITEPSNPNK